MALAIDLAGHCILITGGSSGIGAGIARRLSEAGAKVLIGYRTDRAAAETVAADCAGSAILAADLTESGAADRLFDQALEVVGRIDGLVNCAGPQTLAPFDALDERDWASMQAAHVNAPAQLIRRLAAHASKAGHPAAVVNIASIEADRPAPAHAHYAVAKAGLVMLTRAAALECGPLGVRVNAISPGLIGRPGIEAQWPEGVERWQKAAPLGRLGRPRDIADATAFLLSPLASWITGANLVVDGGVSAGPGW